VFGLRLAFEDLPIRRKITFTAMFASSVALCLACAGFLTHETISIRQATVAKLRGVGGVVAESSKAALEADDRSAAGEALSALRAEDQILSACIYDSNGRLFADYTRDASIARCGDANRRRSGSYREGEETILALPIELAGEVVGSFVIRSLTADLLPMLGRFGALIAVLVLISGLLAYWLASHLQRFISAPIMRLVETSRQVSASKDYSLRAAECGDDEVGLLVSAYNQMLEQIQDRDRALEETRGRLDETIQSRTAELVTAVEELREEITQRKVAEEQIRYMAYYDSLTGLPNRQYLCERLEETLREARKNDSLLALLFIDLDHFKEINDSFGHSTGDMLLGSIARRLAECVRSSDDVTTLSTEEPDTTASHTVSRQGGDEFTILLTEIANSFDASRIATRILEALKEPFSLDGRDVVVSASIGIAIFPHDGDDSDTLLKHADTAMYHAKKSGRNDYQYFSNSMMEEALHKLTLEGDLRLAIERKEFELYYQPKIDSRTDRACGLEVLIRWRHPERGMVSPVEFIPIAEETGLIVPIGEWVLRVACSQTRTWHNSGVHNLPISVNVSSRQFRKNALMETVTEILAESGLSPRQLELEVTETTMLQDEDEAITALLRLKDLGIQVALDDFGTGYSSLSYVRRLPLDTIKIDRSFVKDLGQDSESASIVTAIIAMAHSLGLRVVAEGVETEEQAEFLRNLGCEELQGFLYSEPVPASAIPALLEGDKKMRRVQ